MKVLRASSNEEAKPIAEWDPFIIKGIEAYTLQTMEYAKKENDYLNKR